MQKKIEHRWEFSNYGDLKGWSADEKLCPEVMGGALCLKINSDNKADFQDKTKGQIYADGLYEIKSPDSFATPADRGYVLTVEILNLSPETDGIIEWEACDGMETTVKTAYFAMSPHTNKWQEIECAIEASGGSGEIKNIKIMFGLLGKRGNIAVKSISLVESEIPVKEHNAGLYVCGTERVPNISLKGVSQSDFQMAFDILEECIVTNVPLKGFDKPFVSPGGNYGPCWWQLDTSLALCGIMWVNQKFAEDTIRGFISVQNANPDGRIDLWGGSPIRGWVGDISSLPKYIPVAYEVALRSSSCEFVKAVYDSIDRYLKWWLSPVKRDGMTGLIMGMFEESFEGFNWSPQTIAQLDLNVEVAVGCKCASGLAGRCGYKEDAKYYNDVSNQIKASIYKYLWNDKEGGFYPYNLKEKKHLPDLICSTFDPMRLGDVPEDIEERLLELLTDDNYFNWKSYPVTSVSKKAEKYVEAVGDYDGTAWNGDIWTLRNQAIIEGLRRIGKHELAGELAYKTVTMFAGNYAEYLKPGDGSGHGVKRYAWTAAQIIKILIEDIFGIRYDNARKTIAIKPCLPSVLKNQTISIKDVILSEADNKRISIVINDFEEFTDFEIEISGEIDGVSAEVYYPCGKNKKIAALNGLSNESIKICENKDDGAVSAKIECGSKMKIKFTRE